MHVRVTRDINTATETKCIPRKINYIGEYKRKNENLKPNSSAIEMYKKV